MLNCFHPIPERYGQTDGRTDIFAISISRVSMLTRDIDMLGDTVLGLSVEALALRLWRRLHHCLIPYFNPVFNPIINDNLNPAIDLTLSLLIHRMQISSWFGKTTVWITTSGEIKWMSNTYACGCPIRLSCHPIWDTLNLTSGNDHDHNVINKTNAIVKRTNEVPAFSIEWFLWCL